MVMAVCLHYSIEAYSGFINETAEYRWHQCDSEGFVISSHRKTIDFWLLKFLRKSRTSRLSCICCWHCCPRSVGFSWFQLRHAASMRTGITEMCLSHESSSVSPGSARRTRVTGYYNWGQVCEAGLWAAIHGWRYLTVHLRLNQKGHL
jgi:hypothetical protein